METNSMNHKVVQVGETSARISLENYSMETNSMTHKVVQVEETGARIGPKFRKLLNGNKFDESQSCASRRNRRKDKFRKLYSTETNSMNHKVVQVGETGGKIGPKFRKLLNGDKFDESQSRASRRNRRMDKFRNQVQKSHL
jgi:hypothetical protein